MLVRCFLRCFAYRSGQSRVGKVFHFLQVSEFGNAFYFLLGQSKDLSTFIYKTYSMKRLPQYRKMLWSCGHPGFDRINFRLRWQNSPLDKQQAKSGSHQGCVNNVAGDHVWFSNVQPFTLTTTLLWAFVFPSFVQNSRTWGTFPKANCTRTARFSCTV